MLAEMNGEGSVDPVEFKHNNGSRQQGLRPGDPGFNDGVLDDLADELHTNGRLVVGGSEQSEPPEPEPAPELATPKPVEMPAPVPSEPEPAPSFEPAPIPAELPKSDQTYATPESPTDIPDVIEPQPEIKDATAKQHRSGEEILADLEKVGQGGTAKAHELIVEATQAGYLKVIDGPKGPSIAAVGKIGEQMLQADFHAQKRAEKPVETTKPEKAQQKPKTEKAEPKEKPPIKAPEKEKASGKGAETEDKGSEKPKATDKKTTSEKPESQPKKPERQIPNPKKTHRGEPVILGEEGKDTKGQDTEPEVLGPEGRPLKSEKPAEAPKQGDSEAAEDEVPKTEGEPSPEKEKTERPIDTAVEGLKVLVEKKVFTREEQQTIIKEKLDYLLRVQKGEAPEDPTVIEEVVTLLQSEKIILASTIEKTTKITLSEKEENKELASRIADGLDQIFEKETFVAETIAETGLQETLSGINDAIFDENGKVSKEGLTVGIEDLKDIRERMLEKADALEFSPVSDEAKTVLARQHDIKTFVEDLDALIANLEDFTIGNEFTFTLTETEQKLLMIENTLALISVLRVEIPPVEPEPQPVQPPEPVPVPERVGDKEILLASGDEVLKAMAWRVAENRLQDIINGNAESDNWFFNTGFGRALRGSWAKLGERGFLRKFYREAYEGMRDDQDLQRSIDARLGGESAGAYEGTADNRETYEILDNIIEQMRNNVMEREENGESIQEGGRYFAELFQRHLEGEFATRQEFEAAARETVNNLIANGTIDPEQFAAGRGEEVEGMMFASNLWALAEANRTAYIERYGETGEYQELSEGQKEQMADFVASMGRVNLRLANKLADLEEQRAQRPDRRNGYVGRFEQLLDVQCKRHPILGAVVNPFVFGLGVSSGASILARGAIAGAVVAGGVTGGVAMALPMLGGAAIAATIAGVRRSGNLKYDRGMEQRREALGQELRGTRAQVARSEALRERGFSGFVSSAENLTRGLELGDPAAAVEAQALLQVQRQLRAEGRPADLIYVGAEESGRTGSNITGMTALKIALQNFINENGINEEQVAERAAWISAQVEAQDENFESYRTREAIVAGAVTGTFAVAAGLVANVAIPRVWAAAHGETYNRVDMLSVLSGQKPHAATEAIYTINGKQPITSHFFKEPATLPGTKTKVDVVYQIIDNGGKPTVKASIPDLPSGYTFNPANGQIVHHLAGAEIHTGNPGSWLKGHRVLADRLGIDTAHASWIKSADQGTAPIGNSFARGFNPRANSIELNMDIRPHKGGGGIIDISRAFGRVAYGDGHHFNLSSGSMDHVVVTISPHDRVAEHAALVLPVDSHGHAQVPKELYDQVFTHDGRVKNDMMVTVSQVMGRDHGKTRLFQMMTDYGGKPGAIKVSGSTDASLIPLPMIDYTPPSPEATLSIPVAIPIDARRPVASIGRRNARVQSEAIGNERPTVKKQRARAISSTRAVRAERQTMSSRRAAITAERRAAAPKRVAQTERRAAAPSRTAASENDRIEIQDRGDRIEIPALRELSNEQLSLMYRRLSLFRGADITADQKASYLLRYFSEHFSADVAKSLSNVQLDGGRSYDVAKLNEGLLDHYIATILLRIEELNGGRNG